MKNIFDNKLFGNWHQPHAMKDILLLIQFDVPKPKRFWYKFR